MWFNWFKAYFSYTYRLISGSSNGAQTCRSLPYTGHRWPESSTMFFLTLNKTIGMLCKLKLNWDYALLQGVLRPFHIWHNTDCTLFGNRGSWSKVWSWPDFVWHTGSHPLPALVVKKFNGYFGDWPSLFAELQLHLTFVLILEWSHDHIVCISNKPPKILMWNIRLHFSRTSPRKDVLAIAVMIKVEFLVPFLFSVTISSVPIFNSVFGHSITQGGLLCEMGWSKTLRCMR